MSVLADDAARRNLYSGLPESPSTEGVWLIPGLGSVMPEITRQKTQPMA
jgi:hypothetical protein